MKIELSRYFGMGEGTNILVLFTDEDEEDYNELEDMFDEAKVHLFNVDKQPADGHNRFSNDKFLALAEVFKRCDGIVIAADAPRVGAVVDKLYFADGKPKVAVVVGDNQYARATACRAGLAGSAVYMLEKFNANNVYRTLFNHSRRS